MKKSIQLSYPWNRNKLITLTNVSFLQISIECPHVFPLEHLVEHGTALSNKVVLSIQEAGNSKDYNISDKEILEFSDLYVSQMDIGIREVSNPYIIVDISYE